MRCVGMQSITCCGPAASCSGCSGHAHAPLPHLLVLCQVRVQADALILTSQPGSWGSRAGGTAGVGARGAQPGHSPGRRAQKRRGAPGSPALRPFTATPSTAVHCSPSRAPPSMQSLVTLKGEQGASPMRSMENLRAVVHGRDGVEQLAGHPAPLLKGTFRADLLQPLSPFPAPIPLQVLGRVVVGLNQTPAVCQRCLRLLHNAVRRQAAWRGVAGAAHPSHKIRPGRQCRGGAHFDARGRGGREGGQEGGSRERGHPQAPATPSRTLALAQRHDAARGMEPGGGHGRWRVAGGPWPCLPRSILGVPAYAACPGPPNPSAAPPSPDAHLAGRPDGVIQSDVIGKDVVMVWGGRKRETQPSSRQQAQQGCGRRAEAARAVRAAGGNRGAQQGCGSAPEEQVHPESSSSAQESLVAK